MNHWTRSLVLALSCSASVAAAESERTFETQAALKALGYDIGSVDGSWGPRTEAAISKFAADVGDNYEGEVSPGLWVKLASEAKDSFPFPYLSLQSPIDTNNSKTLLIDTSKNFNSESCNWLIEFYKNENWGRDLPETISEYKNRFGPIIVPDVSASSEIFEPESNELHDALLATTQACYATSNQEPCSVLIEFAQMMKDESAFVFNNKIEDIGVDTYYYTTKRILNPALVGYAAAIEEIGVPGDHEEIGDWFYTALAQNTFDPFLPPNMQQKDMMFYEPDENTSGSCSKYVLSFNHSFYHALGLSFYGSIWGDKNAESQAFDRLLYSLQSDAISEEGAIFCEASRGSNAMMYSGQSMINILNTVQLARNRGVDVETPEVISQIENVANFIFDSAFNFSKIEPYASENFLSWCGESYENQCMYNSFGRIASFSWMRHFANLYPESELSQKILGIRSTPLGTDDESYRVSGAIAKSNFLISEVSWLLPQELEDDHETHTRSNNGTQFLSIMDANLFSNMCLLQIE